MRCSTYTLVAALSILFFNHSDAQDLSVSNEVFPDSCWTQLEKPDTLGWNIEKLIELEQFIINRTNITGLIIINHGKMLFSFGDIQELSYIASCRKSVLSILYGPYVESGKINLEETLGELGIEDYQKLLEIEKRATVRDLLMARSGVFLPSTESATNRNSPQRGSKAPGTFFLYNNWDFNVAGSIFEMKSGKNIYDAFQEELAQPLKMEDWERSKQRKEIFGDYLYSKFPEYHMWLSTRDMARIGYLMLRHGKWNGRQLIPKWWTEKITGLVTPVAEMRRNDPDLKNKAWWKWGYGYLWRVWDTHENIAPELEGAYTATGSWGQYITVIPSLDVVIAVKTKNAYQRSTHYEPYLKMIDLLLSARKDYPREVAILKSRGTRTIADVISVRRYESKCDYLKYSFDYHGQKYYGWSSSSENIPGGSKYEITFDPENPAVNIIDLRKEIKK
ncbi:MAG TPA: serine hydrolase [Bacteroidota bacterium]|nr:serine hydrolase [Bacteroidota bacterium]